MYIIIVREVTNYTNEQLLRSLYDDGCHLQLS